MLRPLAIAALVAALAAPAHAVPAGFTPAGDFVAPADGTMTFTFLGAETADVDTVYFTLNGQALFSNFSAVGTSVTENVLAGASYSLAMVDTGYVHQTWLSNPVLNSDGQAHLAVTNDWSLFHLGALPTGATGPFYGWEDRATAAEQDFNDIVFSQSFASAPSAPSAPGTSVPEPVSLSLLGIGLLGLGVARRRA